MVNDDPHNGQLQENVICSEKTNDASLVSQFFFLLISKDI